MEVDVFAFADDDDAYAGGGFNEFVEPEPEEPEEIDKPEEQEKPPEKPEPKPEPEPQHDDTGAYDFMLSQTAKMRQEIDATRKQLDEARRPVIEEPTEDDWIKNPNEASKKLLQAERAREEAQSGADAEKRQAGVNEAAFTRLSDAVPRFKDDPTLRSRWANLFYSNPEYMNTPDGSGVLKAAQDVAKLFYNKPKPKPEPKPEPEPTATPDTGVIKPDPNTDIAPAAQQPNPRTPPANDVRRQALKQGVMHGSGKGGGKQSVKIDPMTRKYQRLFGVSDAAVMATMPKGGK